MTPGLAHYLRTGEHDLLAFPGRATSSRGAATLQRT